MLWYIELKFCIWLFYLTTDQVWVLSNCINLCRSYAIFGTYNTGNTQFSAFFSYILWHIELKLYIWLSLTVLQIKFECRQFASIFVGVMPLLELRILEIHSLPHFSPTCFDILSWNFLNDFVKCTIRLSSSVITLCPSGSLSIHLFSALSSHMYWQI